MTPTTSRLRALGLLAVTMLAATPALAHTGHGDTFSPLEGFLHPITGPDHLVAMLCVGLWSALAGGRSVYWWPFAFVAAMIAGGVVAHAAVDVPAVELVITGSLIAVGGLLALGIRPPLAAGAAVVAGFAFFHGFAHGAEAPDQDFWGYVAGFSASTALIHLAGIGLGLALIRYDRRILGRVAGGAAAALGVVLLVV